jgi:hypothetical protein
MSASPKEKKRRRRTGCLTCRRRRVRCDEAKPVCERCNAANVECLGYEQKKQVAPRPSRPGGSNSGSGVTPSTPAVASPAFTLRQADAVATLFPKFRVDGLPLVGLPSNPRPDQRPHARARDLLAYHQFLLRTLPLLFPVEHQSFWRDRICEEAWESEYVFLAVTALGGLHRAVLMMSTASSNDSDRGLDTKVISVQTYTSALEQLSEHMQEAEASLDVLTGVLVLLAYFEVSLLVRSQSSILTKVALLREHSCRHRSFQRSGTVLFKTQISKQSEMEFLCRTRRLRSTKHGVELSAHVTC